MDNGRHFDVRDHEDIPSSDVRPPGLNDPGAELERAQQLLDAYMWNSPVAVIEFDPEDHVTRWSAEAERVFGYLADEIVGQSIFDRKWVYEEDEPLVDAEVHVLLGDGAVRTRSVNRNYRKDGTVIWCEWYSSAIRDGDGRLMSVLSLVLDVTERVRTEERLAILAESNALLLASDDPERLIQTVGEKVMRHLGADVFFNYVLDPGADRLRLNAFGGVDERLAKTIERLEPGQAICGCVAQYGERIISNDVQGNGDPRADLVRRMGVRSYVCHPIKSGAETVGTLSFGTKSKDAFEDDEIELMRTVVNQVSVAMRKARSEEETRKELGRTRVLEAAAEAATGSMALDEVAGHMLAALRDQLNMRMGMAYVRRTERPGELELLAQVGMGSDFAAAYRVIPIQPNSPALVVKAVRENRMVTSDELEMTPERRALLNEGGIAGSHNVAVPIHAQGRIAGVLSFVFDNEHDFTGDERAVYTSLARILGQAVDNARLFDTLSEQARYAEALNRINKALHSSLDYDEILDRVVVEVRDALQVDAVIIQLHREGYWEFTHHVGLPKELRHAKPSDEETPLSMTMLHTGQPIVVNDVANDDRVNPEIMHRFGIKSLLGTPIIVRGEVVGVLLADRLVTQAAFSDQQVDFLRKSAGTLGLALENARLYEAERNIAETLQDTLVKLPPRLPEVEFSSAYHSATSEIGRVGGDFVDLFEVAPHLIGLVIGDVSGKGIDAAVITSLVRNTIRAHAVDGLSPSAVCEKTNHVIRRFTDVEAYVTMFFGLLNTGNGLLRYVSAGHPPVLALSGAEVPDELIGTGPILGAFDESQFPESQRVVGARERLVLYTDGVTEAKSSSRDEFLGMSGLKRFLQEHSSTATTHLADALMNDVLEFSEGRLRDDVAILAIEASELRPSVVSE